ncbi:MAG: phenylacetic acid degradation protein [Saccharospirillaceae bacterium]|nr:phenylacetic acid degradation protein [Saccharospirillaceae bacterium]
MHIIIGIITAIASLAWALNSLQRSGFSISSLNPFNFMRKRRWQKKFATKPLYQLTHPMDAASVILIGTIKQEGDISKQQKEKIINIFEQEFKMSKNEATSLFVGSIHLIKDEIDFVVCIKNILLPCKNAFSSSQTDSFIQLLGQVSKIEGDILPIQQQIIDEVKRALIETKNKSGW